MEFKDLPMPFQEMAANVVRSQLATLDLSTVEKETIDTISGNVRRAFIVCMKRSAYSADRIRLKTRIKQMMRSETHYRLTFGRRKTSTATGTKCRHRGPHLDCHEITQM